jgi:hypothetical protein
MNDPVEFFLREALAHARTMPLRDAALFLHGFVLSCADKKVADQVRPLFVQVSESDRQLELIQSGQMKLNLHAHE